MHCPTLSVILPPLKCGSVKTLDYQTTHTITGAPKFLTVRALKRSLASCVITQLTTAARGLICPDDCPRDISSTFNQSYSQPVCKRLWWTLSRCTMTFGASITITCKKA